MDNTTRVYDYATLGKEIAATWGKITNLSRDEFIKKLSDEERMVCLLAALVNGMDRLNSSISGLPQQMAKAQLSEERALEREKQKTARAQEKANESAPPTINVATIPREHIERAFNNGRVFRRF